MEVDSKFVPAMDAVLQYLNGIGDGLAWFEPVGSRLEACFVDPVSPEHLITSRHVFWVDLSTGEMDPSFTRTPLVVAFIQEHQAKMTELVKAFHT